MTEEQERGLRRRLLLWQLVVKYGAAFIILIFYVTVMMHFSSTPDDTYVYLQYGRNIARGDGFSFNAGSPSYGVTGPLWALLIAGGAKLSLDPYIVAKTLDVVFASLAVLAAIAFAFIVIRDRIYALVAAFAVSFDAWVLRWAGSGTETSLAMLLALVALWFAYKKEYLQSSLAAGILTLVRPEGVFLFLASIADAALNSRSEKGPMKIILASVALYCLTIGSWALVAFAQFGDVVPNAFRNWMSGQFSFSGMITSAVSALSVIGTTQALSVLLTIAGVLIIVRRSGWRIIREEGFPLLWVVAVPLCLALLNAKTTSRHLVIVLPVIVVYGIWGIKRLETTGLISPRRAFLLLLVATALSLGQNQMIYRGWIVPHLDNLTLGVNECLKPIAYWLRTNTPAGTRISTPDPGVIGYVSEREIFDTEGTIRLELSRAAQVEASRDSKVTQSGPSDVQPDYIVDRSSVPNRIASGNLQPIMTRTFSASDPFSAELTYYTLYKVHQ